MTRSRLVAAAVTGTAVTGADTLAAALLHDTALMLAALPVLAAWTAMLAWHARKQDDYAPTLPHRPKGSTR